MLDSDCAGSKDNVVDDNDDSNYSYAKQYIRRLPIDMSLINIDQINFEFLYFQKSI